jgi:FtsP/CotA-like multicopper oxidase with cupredoxin domain
VEEQMRRLIVGMILFLGVTANSSGQICPDRPVPGSIVSEPFSVQSQNGVAQLDLAISNYKDIFTRAMFYCLLYTKGIEAPTIRVNPGDSIALTLTNRIRSVPAGPALEMHGPSADGACNGMMTAGSTNIHFHGLNVPPKCHQDEVIYTLVNPGDPPFQYYTTIPRNEPPGLYWYHPHPHGITQAQVMGGASGAIIVEGIEKVKPEVAGLTQRVLIFRDIVNSGDPDAGTMTLNFIPVNPPHLALPLIEIHAGEKQFWRVLNAQGEDFLNLQLLYDRTPQKVQIVSLDGTPLLGDQITDTVSIPPAGRAEFIMQGPSSGSVNAAMVTLTQDTGIDGDPNPGHAIAVIAVNDRPAAAAKQSPPVEKEKVQRFTNLDKIAPDASRKLYFSEDLSDPQNPKFFITVDGQTPKQFDPNDPPAIVTTQGAVEDWTIENRAREIHAFHMHQIHFLLVARDGQDLKRHEVMDTVTVAPWAGSGPYPSVKVRMDFRYKESVGTFVYHCHILDHEDGGMMAKIEVDPK